MSFAVVLSSSGHILAVADDPQEAWDLLVDFEDDAGIECELAEINNVGEIV